MFFIYNLIIKLLYDSERLINQAPSGLLNTLANFDTKKQINNIIPFKTLQNKQSKRKYYGFFAELYIYIIRLYKSELIYNQPILPVLVKKKIDIILNQLNSIELIEKIEDNNENIEKKNILLLIRKILVEIFYELLI